MCLLCWAFANTNNMIRGQDKGEKVKTYRQEIGCLRRKAVPLSESGFYGLILCSDKPEGKGF